jgi:hypothetical protein
MRPLATLALLAVLASPAMSAVIHDESSDGDLSTDPAAPTPVAFPTITNTILGTVSNSAQGVDRDYITFTIDSDRVVTALNLLALAPNNLAFLSFNSGATSFVPSAATSASFLAGIHVSGPQVGTNLMPLFVDNSVTTNALTEPFLGPGTYCFLIQQTSMITQSYSLEFEVAFVLPAQRNTWGSIKALYR